MLNILFVVMLHSAGVSIHSVEYNTEASCVTALNTVKAEAVKFKRHNEVIAICTRK
jgi:hypothetical protein